MSTWDLLVDGISIAASVEARSVSVAESAHPGTGILRFRTRPGASVSVAPEKRAEFYVDGNRVFRGITRVVETVVSPFGRAYDVTCQDSTSELAADVIESDGARPQGESDRTRISALMSAWGTRGITVGAEVQTLKSSMPEADYTGLTLYDALAEIARYTGATFYVGASGELHYFASESYLAPFDLSDAPSPPASYGYADLAAPVDTTDLVNRVVVYGADGVPPVVREDLASQATYGVRTGAIRDGRLSVPETMQAYGDAFLAEHAAKVSASCRVFRAGLRAGQTVYVTSAALGWNAKPWTIASVELNITTASDAVWTVQLGTPDTTLASTLGALRGDVVAAASTATQAVATAVDTVAPAIPTNLVLSSALVTQPDGTQVPAITATWDRNAEPDVERYDVQASPALSAVPSCTVSVGGTGGTLAAGTYRVQVTGLGTVSGETAASAVQSIDLAAGQRLYVTIDPPIGSVSGYRVYASRDPAPKQTTIVTQTTGTAVEIPSEGTGPTAPTTSTALSYEAPIVLAVGQTASGPVTARIVGVAGSTYHGVRVRAVDRAANASDWRYGTLTTVRDTQAPSTPTGLTATAGYRLIGATWVAVREADLAYYELRYYQGASPPPSDNDWTVIRTGGTVAIIGGLSPDVPYLVAVRAVDRSGNASAWSSSVTATPTKVGAADLAVNSVVTQLLNAGTISADQISGGALRVGGSPGATTQVAVYDSGGRLAGMWFDGGLVIYDPANTQRQIRFADGSLQFSTDGGTTWSTAINADGVTASSILLGTLSGGPNTVQNGGFELAAWHVPLSRTWTVASDWGADVPTAGTYRVNVDRSGNELKLVTY